MEMNVDEIFDDFDLDVKPTKDYKTPTNTGRQKIWNEIIINTLFNKK